MNNLGRGSENNKKDKDGIFTRETAGLVLILFAAIALVILISRNVIFGNVGFAISSFLLGAFGYCSYAVLAALIYAGVVLLTGKKLAVPRRRAVFCVLLFVFLVCLVHTITAAVGGIVYGSYGEYLSACYKAGENSFFQTTGGGVIIGLIVYPVVKLTTAVGGYIIFSLLILGTAYLIYATETASKAAKRHAEVPPQADYATSDTSALYSLNYADPMQQKPETENVQPSQMYAQPQQTVTQPSQMYAQPSENSAARSKRLYAIGDEFDMKTKREMRQETRRAEEERRASKNQPQSAPVSPYAQSHSILYPDRKGSGDYSWYNERFGSGGGSYSPSRSSKAAEPAPFGSYTSNGIFDKDSYFNNPNRGAISREQYSNNFRAPGSSNFSEGHELSTPRTPAPKPQEENLKQTEQTVKEEKPAQTYSDLYADGTENNISYSERPKKSLQTRHRRRNRHANRKIFTATMFRLIFRHAEKSLHIILFLQTRRIRCVIRTVRECRRVRNRKRIVRHLRNMKAAILLYRGSRQTQAGRKSRISMFRRQCAGSVSGVCRDAAAQTRCQQTKVRKRAGRICRILAA